MKNGIDLENEALEIAVCAQHNNGGLKGNIWWESNIKHLFPVGEVCGSHGVYRPGGSALNAGQVGSFRAAQYISKRYNSKPRSVLKLSKTVNHQIIKVISKTSRQIKTDEIKNLNLDNEIKQLQKRMSAYGGIIRNKLNVLSAVKNSEIQCKNVSDKTIYQNKETITRLFKVEDLVLTHWIYLEAIKNYIEKAGKSRGSFVVSIEKDFFGKSGLNLNGAIDLVDPKDFVNKHIQEIYLNDKGELHVEWVKTRPIPDRELWFENVWKDFREDKIIS